jgi:hypothetical protein
MPALTRRRDLDAQDECWHVYYGDVRAGMIAKRIGIHSDRLPPPSRVKEIEISMLT